MYGIQFYMYLLLSHSVGIDVVISTFDTLILPAGGRSTATIPVSLVEDTIAEASEWFLVRISVGSNDGEVISGVGTANITIIDNDRNYIKLIYQCSLQFKCLNSL